jgi:hypothetical protein
MKKDAPTPVHTWLLLNKAMQAITRYVLADLDASGLGVSDFAVLEVLRRKCWTSTSRWFEAISTKRCVMTRSRHFGVFGHGSMCK